MLGLFAWLLQVVRYGKNELEVHYMQLQLREILNIRVLQTSRNVAIGGKIELQIRSIGYWSSITERGCAKTSSTTIHTQTS